MFTNLVKELKLEIYCGWGKTLLDNEKCHVALSIIGPLINLLNAFKTIPILYVKLYCIDY